MCLLGVAINQINQSKHISIAPYVASESEALYMGCSDVSEFEHIYGQIVSTTSCVYDR